MKKYKTFLAMVLLSSMLFLLCGCNQYKGPYVFWRQSRENIQKVEICTYEDDVQTVILELPADEVDTFLDEVSNLEFLELITHPIIDYGIIAVVITYADGEKEVISSSASGYVSQDGKFHPDSYVVNNNREFYDLVCNYVPQESFPNLKEHFPYWFDEDGNLIPTEELE